MANTIEFSATNADGPTGTASNSALLSWVEPEGDFQVIVEPIPGSKPGIKPVGQGEPQYYAAEILIEGDDQEDMREKEQEWKDLRGGQGTLGVVEGTYTASLPSMVLMSAVETAIGDDGAFMALRFLKGA